MKFFRCFPLSLPLFLLCVGFVPGFAQTEQVEAARRVVNRVVPAYPNLARTMNLSGTVKLQAVVGPNGAVKSVRVLGGNPLLAESAQTAVREWRWEKTDHETTELLEVRFHP